MGNQVAQEKVEEGDGDGSEDQTPEQTPSLTEPTAQDGAATTKISASEAQNRVERSPRPRGKNSSLRFRAEDEIRSKALENTREISTSLKRINELAEERIALLAYRKEEFETPEYLQARQKYLRLLRKKRLSTLRRRVCGADRGTPRAIGDSQGSILTNSADSVSAPVDGNEVSDSHISDQRNSEVQNTDG